MRTALIAALLLVAGQAIGHEDITLSAASYRDQRWDLKADKPPEPNKADDQRGDDS
jgi:hypothetical protein